MILQLCLYIMLLFIRSSWPIQDPQNSSRNRGFSFIEYYNHACAEYSRLKMSSPTFKLENNAPTVSWADPKNAESSAASQVCLPFYDTIFVGAFTTKYV